MAHAHLPPKIPNPSSNPADNCWVDEFFDFSSATTTASHRRSISDSITYLQEQGWAPEDCFMGMFAEGPSSSEAEHNQVDDQIIADPKRVKRILANRQSAQRSRVRKLHYISDLERTLTSLQAEVSVLSPRVAFLDHQRLLLNVDNSALKQRIAALAQDKIFKDAHEVALRREIQRLRQVYEDMEIRASATFTRVAEHDQPQLHPHHLGLLDAST